MQRWIGGGVALAMLAACGGGGGGGGAVTVVTPAPTPTPTPSPTPTTVTGSYTAATDFTIGRSNATTIGYRTDTFLPDAGPTGLTFAATLLDAGAGAQVDYAPAGDRLTYRYEAATIAFAAADRQPTDRSYARGEDTLSVFPPAAGLTYVNQAIWRGPTGRVTQGGRLGTISTQRLALFGAETLLTDTLPASGAYAGTLAIEGVIPGQINYTASPAAMFAVDVTAGTVTGTVTAYTGGTVPTQQLRFSGTLDRRTNRIAGTVTNAANTSTSGTFAGALYGPNALELGFAFRLSRTSDGAIYAGTFGGRR